MITVISANTTAEGLMYVPDYISFKPTAEQCKNCEFLFAGADRMLCIFASCHKKGDGQR